MELQLTTTQESVWAWLYFMISCCDVIVVVFFTCLCGKRCKIMERRLKSKDVQSLIHKFRVEECLWNVTSPKYADADVGYAMLQLQSISVAPDGIPAGTVTNHEFVESICICRRMSRDSVLLQ